MKSKLQTTTDKDSIIKQQHLTEAIHRTHLVLEMDFQGRILTANANFLTLLGCSLEEIQHKRHQTLMDPMYAKSEAYQSIWKSLHQGENPTAECKWLGKNDENIWLMSCFSIIENQSGETESVLLLARDITEEKCVRLEREQKYQLLMDIVNMTSIVSYSDLKGNITDINEKYIQVSKFDREELIGSPHNITRHPDMPKATFKKVWNTIGHGKVFRGVIKNRAKDGTHYYVDAVIAPLLGKNGKPREYIGVRYDITEQETERQNMKGILSAINTSYSYLELDPDGYVLSANDVFLALTDYRSDQVIGKHHRMFIDSSESNTDTYNLFWQDLRNGLSCEDTYQLLTHSGSHIWLQGAYTPVKDEMERVIKIVCIATNITEQVNTNVDYRNRVKGYSDFISKVASGNLQNRIEDCGNNELSVIGGNLNSMVESLNGIAIQISDASNTLFDTINQMQSTVNLQASGASQQAAAVNEISVTLEEIRSTSEQNLAKTKQLGDVAERVRREGIQGQEMLAQVISCMERIHERVENIADTILALSAQTQQISEITAAVSTIAQQSKMLALNASIEAAKAGEAGKGFAVVAAEVKELAIQSQHSTAQVQKILQDIRRAMDKAVMATEEGNKQVDAGVLLVEKSGVMMEQLNGVINETQKTSKQIVATVQQEVIGIDQVALSMNEINNATLHFADSTNRVKNATTDLAQVALRLKECVSIYKTSE